jgi:hypothetical protein
MSKRNKKKKPINPLWIWAALLAVVVILFTTYLVQRQTPPLDKTVAIRSALVDSCRRIGNTLYKDMSQDLLTNACYQEAIDLFATRPDAATYCYDAVATTKGLSWGECMASEDADFSGVYLRAAAQQP